ncbi:chemotaxis protein CheX [Roseiconus lacunae]|uniref:chemotaxis protein CheX n=1 Tax=Roseiconus lacunae TaxID=2605694 RepID=UPI001E5DACF7|nr:chemotaxis protein CheX [Roseiconus lacunae]MCD0463481.1 chemotaxis protein CheX [Roseiconus lacunae]WRQ53361.1 chemotaxis protein CheX [Stieleria sp. HD01]
MQPSAIDPVASEQEDESTVTIEEIAQMVDDLFTAMLELDVNASPIEPPEVTDETLSATVQISGDRNAIIQVFASHDLATKIATAMFAIEANELSEEEILDALGEVVNVIGGNVKGIFDQECALSLPCVGPVPQPLPEDALTTAFELEGEPITVLFKDRT